MSNRDRHNLQRLRRYSRRLNRMIEDGSLEELPGRRLVRKLGRLYESLVGVVPESVLRSILAGAAVVVLGIAGCDGGGGGGGGFAAPARVRRPPTVRARRQKELQCRFLC